ncbi:MAG: hypothetical protein K8R90_04625 [Candidatus Cloacimonetes bacterium]|nr:hypothetical protein [Candidatus Cloacimonadota bacterium]
MKRNLILGILSLAVVLAAQSPFVVEQMSETEIVLRFDLPEWEFADAAEADGQEIRVPGGLPLAEEGKPIVPYFAEVIGLPVNGSFTVQVSGLRQQTLRGVNLRPSLTMQPTAEGREAVVRRDQRAYRTDALYPAGLVGQSQPAFMGDRHFAGLQFFPFQYNAAQRQLVVTTQATLRIFIQGDTRFTPGWETTVAMLHESEGMFLNDVFARKWRKPLEPTTTATQTRSNLVEEIQLVIDEDGIYKITYAMLADSIASWEDSLGYAMVWDLNQLDPRYFELYDRNGEIPIHCVGESDGSFDSADYFEFYGQRHVGDESYYDKYTSENIYRLRLTSNPGARMAVENGGLEVNDPSLYTVPRAFEQTVHFEQQNHFASLGFFPSAPREDLWFWSTITSPSMEIVEIDLQYPYQSTIRGFTASVMLMGSTHIDSLPGVADHHAEVRLNSAIIDNHVWFRQREQLFENDGFISNSFLNHGENILYISLPGDIPGGFEQVLLDYFNLTYWRAYKTDEDFIRFTKPATQPNGLFQFELDNFSQPDVSIYKIGASILENLQVEPFSELGGAPWKVIFQDYINSSDVTYYAVTESEKKQPRAMRMNIPSELRTVDHQANYIIITAQKFVYSEGTQLIEQIWETSGLDFIGKNIDVEVVAVEDIFDEFSDGIRDAQAIRDFLEFAYNNWNYGGSTGRVEFVLLLGDGLNDERDDSYWRANNLIPVKHVWTYKYGATPTDNWYTAVVGADPVGDLHIGRICLWEEEQILVVAQKLQHYIENPAYEDFWHSSITFAAGGKPSDATDIFAQQSEIIRQYAVPEEYIVNRVYTTTQTVSPYFNGNTFTLLDFISSGTIFVQFMGHGGGQIWADNNLFDYDNIDLLTNDKYPIFSSLACYCSSFVGGGASSIGEALVLAEEKGAIGHVGFSGLGYLEQDLSFGIYMNEGLFKLKLTTIGETITYTKARVYANLFGAARLALLEGCVYIGDPGVSMYRLNAEVEVSLDLYNVQERDTLHITATFPSGVNTAKMYIVDEDDVVHNTPIPHPVSNGIWQMDYIVPAQQDDVYERRIKIIGVGDGLTAAGLSRFTVGRTAVMDVGTLPEHPAENDSVRIRGSFHDEDGIQNILCSWESSTDIADSTFMVYNTSLDTYLTVDYVPAFPTGTLVSYRFRILDLADNEYVSPYFSYYVAGPDLKILTVRRAQDGLDPVLEILVENVGVTSSPPYEMELFEIIGNDQRPVLLERRTQPALPPMVQTWYSLPLPVRAGHLSLRLVLNRNREFTESSYLNNTWNGSFTLNFIVLGPGQDELSSIDGNVDCRFPVESIPQGTVAFLDQTGSRDPVHQPGIEPIALEFGGQSVSYEVGLLDTTIYVGANGLLPGNSTLRLAFHYLAADSLGSDWGDEESFGVYRWSEPYQKWIYKGGQVSRDERMIVKDVRQCGVYAVFRNLDDVIPTIDANVEEQEFSYGGYVSGTGTISFILADENGIDVVDNPPAIFLEGREVPLEELHISASLGQLINVPIKYQLDLDKGDYTLIISCSDVNGNFSERHIPFAVNTEFGIINLANYPNPVRGITIEPINEGRTRFTYVLTDDADKVDLKIYTVSGRLVKTFNNLPTSVGYHEFPRTVYGWDCRDDEGQYLANGVYFYKLTAKRGGKTVEEIQKLAILR